jgi:hypothetical protein
MQGSMYLDSGGALGGDCMVEDSSSVAGKSWVCNL